MAAFFIIYREYYWGWRLRMIDNLSLCTNKIEVSKYVTQYLPVRQYVA